MANEIQYVTVYQHIEVSTLFGDDRMGLIFLASDLH